VRALAEVQRGTAEHPNLLAEAHRRLEGGLEGVAVRGVFEDGSLFG